MSQVCLELLVGQMSDYPLQTSTQNQSKIVHTGDTFRIVNPRIPEETGVGYAGELCWSVHPVTKIAYLHLCSESAEFTAGVVSKPAVWNFLELTPA
jgi:hypothetical protein